MAIDNVHELRRDYRGTALLENNASRDPFEQFEQWFSDAVRAELPEPNAMSLATVGENSAPEVRIVLLKGFDREGFTFFTNYGSRKARQIDQTPRASLCFWWAELARQVRISGAVRKVSREASDAYFQSRPRGSRIGAWASAQSSVIESREALTRRMAELEQRFGDDPIPLPEFWGGFVLSPERFEFWQGQSSRLHDRLEYLLDGDQWRRQRLSP